jgi:hypothetical protein
MRTDHPHLTARIRPVNRYHSPPCRGVVESESSVNRRNRQQEYVHVGLLLSLLTLAGCTRSADEQQLHVARLSMEPVARQTEQVQAVQHRTTDNLAYEHTVSIELAKALLPTRVRDIQSACQTDKQFGCTLLDISVRTAEDIPQGSIRIRLAPSGVDTFIDLASQNGAVTARATHAEDLAEQVTDTERELTLLTTHRDRLSDFMKDKSLKVDQLIAVSKELASAQTQIESAGTARANLHRRIDTHLLTLNLSIPQQVAVAQRTPIRDAFSSFGSEFTEAIAQVIRFVAVLIPWLIVIAPGVILIRVFWRGIGRWLSRRDAS